MIFKCSAFFGNVLNVVFFFFFLLISVVAFLIIVGIRDFYSFVTTILLPLPNVFQKNLSRPQARIGNAHGFHGPTLRDVFSSRTESARMRHVSVFVRRKY